MVDRRTLLLNGLGLASGGAAVGVHAADPIRPFFIEQYAPFRKVNWKGGAALFPFTLKEPQLSLMISRVVRAVRASDMALPPVGSRSAEGVGRKIREKVEAVVRDAWGTGSSPSRFEMDWMVAEGVCDYVLLNCFYDEDLGKVTDPSITSPRAETKVILSLPEPGAVCWGIAVLVRDLGRAAGLQSAFISGNCRWYGAPAPRQTDRNHGVACFTLDGGIEVPADVSTVRGTMQQSGTRYARAGLRWRTNGKVYSQFILPRTPEGWELFLARFNAEIPSAATISGDAQNKHLRCSYKYDEWAGADTAHLAALNKRYVDFEDAAQRATR